MLVNCPRQKLKQSLTSSNKSNKPGGGLFLDISGPYLESVGVSKYWMITLAMLRTVFFPRKAT